ncbi:hypothetical protein BOTBODRAFT_59098 [Botryobasidium botryosum FD-172 SS1]|uniref:Eukaryotic translation initiation factor 3 subunit M n=1 Tax=Botryobasidium botryosum (strain FD-172 SS1) TaxID=930990 RepID=A0A067M2H0_BOTB1|nr:hypothetical protein BOTBODRAFT_59098 [Botryobasidium botryosum FD-172 SS1]
MASTDSISIFTEGTFEEQIQELVNYLARGLSEEARVAFIRPFQDVLITREGDRPFAEDADRRRKVIMKVLGEVKGLGEGNEREVEGFFNLLDAHILALSSESSQAKEPITTLIRVLTSTPPSENASIKYRVLSNLFNALPRSSPLRVEVYTALLNLANENQELEVLQISQEDVDRWLSEWEISQDEKSAFLKKIADAYNKSEQPGIAFTYLLSHLRTLASSAAAEPAALDVIAAALRLPAYFDFNDLLKIEGVQAVKENPLFALLKICLSGGLADLQSWEAANGETLTKFEVDRDIVERKIRYLALASQATKYIGRDMPYSEIASVLQVDNKEVEAWVIDTIRAGLLSGKLHQPAQTFHVIRSTSRSFGREEWKTLEKRLLAWKTGLLGVLEVVEGARQSIAESGLALEADKTVQATA